MLATDIVVFYLVLRGLDTVEDDMTAFDNIQVCLSFPVPAEGSGGSPRQLDMMFFVKPFPGMLCDLDSSPPLFGG